MFLGFETVFLSFDAFHSKLFRRFLETQRRIVVLREILLDCKHLQDMLMLLTKIFGEPLTYVVAYPALRTLDSVANLLEDSKNLIEVFTP